MKLALEVVRNRELGKSVSAALDLLVFVLSDGKGVRLESDLMGLFEAVFGVLGGCDKVETGKKAMELLTLLVQRTMDRIPELTEGVVVCVAQVWKKAFLGYDEDAQLKTATLSALIQVFRVRSIQRYPASPALQAELFSVVSYTLDPLQKDSLQLRDVISTQNGLILLIVLLQHSDIACFPTSVFASVLYILENDRDLMELCLISLVELINSGQNLQFEVISAVDNAYKSLINDLNEAGVRVVLHAVILHTYTHPNLVLEATFSAIFMLKPQELTTKQDILHLKSRLKWMNLGVGVDLEEGEVDLVWVK